MRSSPASMIRTSASCGNPPGSPEHRPSRSRSSRRRVRWSVFNAPSAGPGGRSAASWGAAALARKLASMVRARSELSRLEAIPESAARQRRPARPGGTKSAKLASRTTASAFCRIAGGKRWGPSECPMTTRRVPSGSEPSQAGVRGGRSPYPRSPVCHRQPRETVAGIHPSQHRASLAHPCIARTSSIPHFAPIIIRRASVHNFAKQRWKEER